MKTKIIGLTGGIGSGKSTVLELFKEMGAATYIADTEAKKLLQTDDDLKQKVIECFGVESYREGILNKEFLASQVFNDNTKLQQLNSLVHPKVRAHFLETVENTSAPYLIYEAAILFESGSHELCDFIILVTANHSDKIKRVVERDNVVAEKVLARMKHQNSDADKIAKVNFVIRNQELKDTRVQTATIFNLIKKRI